MPPPARPLLLFVIVEDWFFVSHFLGFARAAIAEGLEVAVATRVGTHRAAIEATGARVLPLTGPRGSFASLASETAQLRRICNDERPAIVHLIGLRPIVAGSIAARLAGVRRRVVALTGLGLIGAGAGAKATLARTVIRRVLRPLADGGGTRFVFENRSDPAALGLSPDDAAKVTILGGAGVDPDRYPATPPPPQPPLRLAMVSRMLWSKGVDVAVEAVTRARALGAAAELSLYGAPDPQNPRALSVETLREWGRRPGIVWRGPTSDIAGVWRDHHLALQPSRGGEGLPRTLLEAASCGRGVLTTDVPGCRDFIRDGVEGRVVAVDDVETLARVIADLAGDPAAVAALGAAARARLIDGHTEAAVTGAIVTLYRAMLA